MLAKSQTPMYSGLSTDNNIGYVVASIQPRMNPNHLSFGALFLPQPPNTEKNIFLKLSQHIDSAKAIKMRTTKDNARAAKK
jgi:hypothetical protein